MALLIVQGSALQAQEPATLAIGEPAPAFSLKGIDGETYTLESFQGAKVLTLIFTANHCPTAQAYEERMKELSARYAPGEMQLVAISSNHPGAVCLEELGYTDLGDSFGEMKVRASDKGYNFPYLYDGDEQAMATAYGAKATPHVFIFDRDRKLRYTGRIDDMEDPYRAPTRSDARLAIDALLAEKEVEVETTKAFGCSLKWKSKMDWRKTLDERWKEKPVKVEGIDLEGVTALVGNRSDVYRLINVWATWCVPCVAELPEFVTINRMYRKRPFELITISMDSPDEMDNALKTLRQRHVAATNYIYSSEDREAFAEALDSQWQGPVPYTLLIAPGGEVIYRKLNTIEPLELKRAIVERLGRTYK